MSKPLSQTALKFLSLADVKHGTHVHNFKGYYGELSDRGLLDDGFPFARLTDAGRAELAPYYAAGGLPDGKRRKVAR